jgi:hypothetical protein
MRANSRDEIRAATAMPAVTGTYAEPLSIGE